MPTPRLRFDKVALRFVAELQDALAESVPDGKTLVVTCTAPIRQASKTADEIVERLASRLTRRSAKLELRATINGNQIRVRLLKGRSKSVPTVAGFVHNPDADGDVVIDETRALLQTKV
jgi:hypothetical protein